MYAQRAARVEGTRVTKLRKTIERKLARISAITEGLGGKG